MVLFWNKRSGTRKICTFSYQKYEFLKVFICIWIKTIL